MTMHSVGAPAEPVSLETAPPMSLLSKEWTIVE